MRCGRAVSLGYQIVGVRSNSLSQACRLNTDFSASYTGRDHGKGGVVYNDREGVTIWATMCRRTN